MVESTLEASRNFLPDTSFGVEGLQAINPAIKQILYNRVKEDFISDFFPVKNIPFKKAEK
jgi:hypothetical protein